MMAPHLSALVDRVWGSDTSSPVRVTTSDIPDGHEVVERYAVIPNFEKAKFLVPLGSHAAAVNSLWKYNAMKSLSTRSGHVALAAAFKSRLATLAFHDQLVVSCDRRLDRGERAEWMVLDHLARELNFPRLLAAMTVRRKNPNAKPTLQLFTPGGVPMGYAKLGWSQATRAMVQTEAASLEAVSGKLTSVLAPHVMAKGIWNGRYYVVVSPLPESVRRWSTPPLQAPHLILDVAHSGEVAHGHLAGSPYERRLRQQLDEVGETPETRILSAWLDRLVGESFPLEFGRWHGDWVAWNMGSAGAKVAVWDWEHSAPLVPVGFDALHWHFQQTLPAHGIEAAVLAVDGATLDLVALGVTPSAAPHLVSLYLLEMFVRSVRLANGGGGWNPRLYPKMLTIAEARDR
ncbi:MAG: hypothetical protein H0V49_12655 [Nocardioidaceae bacterium]|nr:hypothetical protein [Nocardioidaceae bacterium]